jgi:hypothetical protein
MTFHLKDSTLLQRTNRNHCTAISTPFLFSLVPRSRRQVSTVQTRSPTAGSKSLFPHSLSRDSADRETIHQIAILMGIQQLHAGGWETNQSIVKRALKAYLAHAPRPIPSLFHFQQYTTTSTTNRASQSLEQADTHSS